MRHPAGRPPSWHSYLLGPLPHASHAGEAPRVRYAVPDCQHPGPLPCPRQACRLHLASGRRRSRPLDPDSPGCSLAVVEANPGGAQLEVVAAALGVRRERVRQIEAEALHKFMLAVMSDATLEELLG
jgi:hypothetical protein